MTTGFPAALADRLLVCDGAIGTMLHAAGNSLDRALPELNLSQPELVSTVHDSYLGAGVDLLLTNTFGAGRLRLGEHGYAGNVRDINIAGVRLARQSARNASRPIFVGGSVSPAVSVSQRQRISAGQRADALREQMRALVDGGVDLLVLETFGYLDELVEAVTVATEVTDLPLIAQVTFTEQGSTPGGEAPGDIARAVNELPVAVLGANCTVGPQRMLAVVSELRRHTTLPISAQPNAGLPRRIGRRFQYKLTEDYFARYARRCADSGASIIGGCCGTTPTHIRAAVEAVTDLPTRRPVRGRPRPVPRVQPPPEGGGVAKLLSERRFVVAAHIAPPAGGGADEARALVSSLHSKGIDLVFVAPARSAQAQVSSTSLALHLQQRLGVETVATVTTWDKSIMTLQADLLGAHAFGMRAVVCETGNPPLRGDYPNADGIWEVDSVGLAGLLAGLNEGRDCNGLPLDIKTSFAIGARLNPGAEDVPEEIARAKAKIRAGAQFLVTRPVYELTRLRRMLDELAEEEVPVLATVSALGGFAEAEYLAYEVPDVTVPERTLSILERAGDDERETGMRLATELLEQARSLVQGAVLVVRDDTSPIDRLLSVCQA
jgi:homocysteine S-methyltransferase